MTADLATRALTRLERTGALRLVDAEFARLLRNRLGAPPQVALAGALAMRAVSLGHSGFSLAAADRRSRSEMIETAVREYVLRHTPKPKR